MTKCPNCSTLADSKFCPTCGTCLEGLPSVNICPVCGAESDSVFCPDCGAKITEAASVSDDIFGELRQYKALLDEGILTQEEFDKKKQCILNENISQIGEASSSPISGQIDDPYSAVETAANPSGDASSKRESSLGLIIAVAIIVISVLVASVSYLYNSDPDNSKEGIMASADIEALLQGEWAYGDNSMLFDNGTLMALENGDVVMSGEYIIIEDEAVIEGRFHASDNDVVVKLPYYVEDGELHITNNNDDNDNEMTKVQ